MLGYPMTGFNHIKHKGTAQVLELNTGGETKGAGEWTPAWATQPHPEQNDFPGVEPSKVAQGMKFSPENQENGKGLLPKGM